MNIKQEIEDRQKDLTDLLAKGISTDDDRAALKGLLGGIETLKAAIGAQDALDQMKSFDATEVSSKEAPSLIDKIMASDAVKGSGSAMFKTGDYARLALGIKAPQGLVTTATVNRGQELLTVDNLGITVTPEFRLPGLLNLASRGTSTADSISWVEMAFTNNAAVVDEATEGGSWGANGGLKPDSENTFKTRVANSQTVAHLKYVTRQALRNRGYLMGLIENELLDGLREKSDELLWTDPNYGILNASGIQVQPFNTSINKTILLARSLVIEAQTTPQAIVMNPLDAVEVYATTDAGGWFYSGGPIESPTPRLWGMPIVETSLCPQGEAFVGDFRSLHIDVTEDPNTATTDSHLDFFARNVEAVRAEMAAIIRLERPDHIVRAALA